MATSGMAETRGYLADVPQECVFWCNDGHILRNLRELCDAFAVMTEHTFTYHVNDAKNDFYNWVRDVVRDELLASELLRVSSTMAAVRVVGDRIALLSAKPVSIGMKKPASARAKKASSGKAPAKGQQTASAKQAAGRKQKRR